MLKKTHSGETGTILIEKLVVHIAQIIYLVYWPFVMVVQEKGSASRLKKKKVDKVMRSVRLSRWCGYKGPFTAGAFLVHVDVCVCLLWHKHFKGASGM